MGSPIMLDKMRLMMNTIGTAARKDRQQAMDFLAFPTRLKIKYTSHKNTSPGMAVAVPMVNTVCVFTSRLNRYK